MLRSVLFVLAAVAITACSTSEGPAPQLAGPGDVEPIGGGSGSGAGGDAGPGVAVVCGAASSEPKCTEADIEKAVNAALAEATAECEAKVEAATAELGAAIEGAKAEAVAGAEAAKAGAVDDALLAVSDGYVAKADAVDSSEWAGVPLRMALGVDLCATQLIISQPESAPGATVYLRRVEPGAAFCEKSCKLQGCVTGSGNGSYVGDGLRYNDNARQWQVVPDGASPDYCCCRMDGANPNAACAQHVF